MVKISEIRELFQEHVHYLDSLGKPPRSPTKHSAQYCQNCLCWFQQYQVSELSVIRSVRDVLRDGNRTAESGFAPWEDLRASTSLSQDNTAWHIPSLRRFQQLNGNTFWFCTLFTDLSFWLSTEQSSTLPLLQIQLLLQTCWHKRNKVN